ncbi:AsnC family transcriptional regulator [Inmirania thermothiophila]|uniref:siroheme decarboxylase n=1 Tax=Inmirania thermothiophila TaxID=1750597 RepID=A0A3N1XS96_9GAMM|nr:AsnC family transcriptional regulator [Inmirania thermothiophila]ROR29524.1 AsnC family transcriptional regulator [Inmirania thermothiophila]
MNARPEHTAWRPDAIDRRIIAATQAGLPLVREPYHAVAEALGLPPEVVMARIRAMLAAGAIRRIAAVPNHYRLGYRANGMAVWDVDDERVDELGRRIARLPFVSHCYRRPRRPPHWPYNLFTMLHGRERAEVEARAAQVRALLGEALRGHEILYSRRILKKTGLRIREG